MSFGGGDSPSDTTYATQYQREAPQIEADKLNLMGTARDLTRFGTNPWERVNADAELGDDDYNQYRYGGDQYTGGLDDQGNKIVDHRWDAAGNQGRLFKDLSREDRTLEGEINIPKQDLQPFHQQQKDAFGLVDEGLGAFQPMLDQAEKYANQATQQYNPNDANYGVQANMNPYQDYVTQGIEDQFSKAQNNLNMQASNSGSFGGGRAALASTDLYGKQAQAVGESLSQNYGQAQQASVGQFQNQMGRYGEAAQQMAGLGGQQQQQNQGDIASLMSSGSVRQQFGQQGLDNTYRQNLQQIYEPYQRLGFTSDIYQGMPTSAMATSMGTAPGTNPLAQAVGAGITGLGVTQGLG